MKEKKVSYNVKKKKSQSAYFSIFREVNFIVIVIVIIIIALLLTHYHHHHHRHNQFVI